MINSEEKGIKVGGFKKSLGFLVNLIFNHFAEFVSSDKIITVLGSVGKTTTANAIKTVLSESLETVVVLNNSLNSKNIPKLLTKVNSKVKKIVWAAEGEKSRLKSLLKMVKPQVVVITRAFNKSLVDAFSKEIGQNEVFDSEFLVDVVKGLGEQDLLVLNWDDQATRQLAENSKNETIFYGTDPKNCHVWASKMRIDNFQTIFELNYGVERVEVKSKLLGFHQIYCLLAAAVMGINQGLPLIKIKKCLEGIDSEEHIMQTLNGHNGSIIVDDSQNSHPLSVQEALETLNHIPARRRIVVFGEMRELGEHSEKLHRLVAKKIYQDKIDLLFTSVGDTKYLVDELTKLGFLSERIKPDLQNPQIVSKLLKIVGKGDIVLVKGPASIRFDELVKRISKYNQNYI